MSYCGRRAPITPATTGPTFIPARKLKLIKAKVTPPEREKERERECARDYYQRIINEYCQAAEHWTNKIIH